MSPEYDNTNSGVLFKNDRKETAKHPDYKGSGNFDGVDVWISAWTKKDKNGNKYLSLSFTAKDQQPESRPASSSPPAQRQPEPETEQDDSLPF